MGEKTAHKHSIQPAQNMVIFNTYVCVSARRVRLTNVEIARFYRLHSIYAIKNSISTCDPTHAVGRNDKSRVDNLINRRFSAVWVCVRTRSQHIHAYNNTRIVFARI